MSKLSFLSAEDGSQYILLIWSYMYMLWYLIWSYSWARLLLNRRTAKAQASLCICAGSQSLRCSYTQTSDLFKLLWISQNGRVKGGLCAYPIRAEIVDCLTHLSRKEVPLLSNYMSTHLAQAIGKAWHCPVGCSTHLSRMKVPTLINHRPGHFCLKRSWVEYFNFIQVLLERLVSKQRRP